MLPQAIIVLAILWPIFAVSPNHPRIFLPTKKSDEIEEEAPLLLNSPLRRISSSANRLQPKRPSPLEASSSPEKWPSERVKPWPIQANVEIMKNEEMLKLLEESQDEIQLDCDFKGGNDGGPSACSMREGGIGEEEGDDPRILVDLGLCHLGGHSYHIGMDLMRMCRLDRPLVWGAEKCANFFYKRGFRRLSFFIKKEVNWLAKNGGKMGEPPIFYAFAGEHEEKFPATAQVKKVLKEENLSKNGRKRRPNFGENEKEIKQKEWRKCGTK